MSHLAADEYVDAHEPPRIAGATAVVGWFGYWPRFHDSEIIGLTLGPDSALRLHAFEMTAETDAAGAYRLRKHCTVSFWFSGEVDFSLASDSGAGGVVFSLEFHVDGDRLRMTIESSCGVGGWIRAKNWRVELAPDA